MVSGSKKINSFIEEIGMKTEIITLDSSTRTSQMAANSLRCELAQIAKSIVFIGENPVVVVISGDKRIDSTKLTKYLGWKAKIADADTVKERTGYSIGGVPPFAHNEAVQILLEKSLARFSEVWAAAGTPYSVMKLRVADLSDIMGLSFIDLAKYEQDSRTRKIFLC